MIVDDARVSRFICHVAERLGMSCLAISKNSDIAASYKEAEPEVILLSINPQGLQRKKVMQQLAEQKTNAAIILAGIDSDQIRDLEIQGQSLGLNMAGALPDIFDTDMLKQKLISILQQFGKQPLTQSQSGNNTDSSIPTDKVTRAGRRK